MRLLLILAVAVMGISCSNEPIVYGNVDRIVVSCVLDSDLKHQTVYLDNAVNFANIPDATMDRSQVAALFHPVTSAVVEIGSSTQMVLFVETEPGVYQDIGEPLEVREGETYQLHIGVTESPDVRAITTVPQRPVIRMPVDSSHILMRIMRPVTYDSDYWTYIQVVGKLPLDIEHGRNTAGIRLRYHIPGYHAPGFYALYQNDPLWSVNPMVFTSSQGTDTLTVAYTDACRKPAICNPPESNVIMIKVNA